MIRGKRLLRREQADPYRAKVQLELSEAKLPCTIHFENTPEVRRYAIKEQPVDLRAAQLGVVVFRQSAGVKEIAGH